MKVKDTALSARQVKAGPDDGLGEGVFTAYASVFGNVDSYGDVVVKGAFDADLKRWEESGNPIPLLFGHNMGDPDYNLGHVMKADEDDHGLLVTAQLDLENPKAMQVYRMLKGRRVNQMSFAYDVLDEDEVEVAGAKANELRELKLYEVSVVTIGANQETEVLAVKANAAALADALKAGRVLAQKHIDSLRSAQEAIGVVIAAAEGDQGKASGNAGATSDASGQEPSGATPSVPGQEPKQVPPVKRLAATAHIYALTGAEGGSR